MSPALWVALLLAGAGTFLLRFSFLALAHRAGDVPEPVREALRMIPAAALAALVAPAILRGGSAGGAIDLLDGRVLAAAAAVVVMRLRGDVLLTIGVGMAVLLATQHL